MTTYIIQMIVFQLVFLVLYERLLKKETFFQWNRAYLCLTPLLALVLPFIKIPALQTTIPQNILVTLPEINLGNATVTNESAVAVTGNSLSIIEILIFSGIVLSIFLFLWKLYKILQLKRKGRTEILENITLVHLPKSTDAFSFAGTIFLGEQLSMHAKEQILQHELVHIRQKHYLDLLYFEGMRIFFWFNPLLYLFQNRVATLHEYIADAETVSNSDKKEYYQNLLSEVFQTQHISFINTFFNHSLIKKRIVMLQKSKSKKWQLVKYALILPVLAGMLLVTSCELNETQSSSENSVEPIVTIDTIKGSKNVIPDVPFAVIDQVPIYPGCENLSTNEERKKCMSEKIDALVRNNFNAQMGNNLGLTGRQRIAVQFKIDQEGNMVDVNSRAPHPDLEVEAKRVINLVPKMQPGMQDGKTVGVLYALPINFEVKSQDE